jgi:hypothetical protein
MMLFKHKKSRGIASAAVKDVDRPQLVTLLIEKTLW